MKAHAVRSSLMVILLAFTVCGCMAGSTFYTGRTLRPWQFTPGFGAQDILVKSTDNSITYSTSVGFVPSFMFQLGLPLRLEADANYILPRLLEVSLRDQVNPRSFQLFDFAPDVSFGDMFGAYTYMKYGATLSKNIGGFEPYIHYSIYDFLANTSGDLSNSLFTGSMAEIINNDRIIGLGVGIPLGQLKIFPEFNYQYFGNNLKWGVYSFGIGIRGIPH